MKKILLVLGAVFGALNFGFSQPNLLITAPTGVSTTQNRAPNGTAPHAYLRACSLVLASELTSLPVGSNISAFGFTLSTGTNGYPVTGNFTVYIQNTTDVTYLKGTNWGLITPGMTTAYASTMTVPGTATTTSVMVTLSNPVPYTGGGLYVAYDWASSGPFAPNVVGNIATYFAESAALNPGGASTASTTPLGTTALGTTVFRPDFLFQVANPYTNDIQVYSVIAPGKVVNGFNTPQNISAIVKNTGSSNQTNVAVTLSVTGANPFSNVQTIPTLAAGSATTVTFTAYNPLVLGANSISVSVPADQNSSNNSATYAQSVTCNTWAQNPAATFTGQGVGFNAAGGILATPYTTSAVSRTLTGLRAAISTDPTSPGNSISGVLLNASGAVLATTSPLTITPGIQGTFQELFFTSPMVLSASTTYYIGFAQAASAAGFYPGATLFSAYVDPNLYQTAPLAGGAFAPLGANYGYFGLEAMFALNIPLSATASQSAICIGSGSVTLTASGVSTYVWSTTSGTVSNSASLSVSPSINTTYSVVGTNSLGCSTSTMVGVLVNSLPNISISSSAPAVCIGSTVSLSASGATTYTWTNGPSSATYSDTPLSTTVYTVTGTNVNSCVNTATLGITVNSVSLSISGSTAVCSGSTATLTVSGADSYLWNNTVPFPDYHVTPTVTTVYTVSGMNATTGCTGSQTVNLLVNLKPTLSVTATRSTICVGESSTLSVSGASTYLWAGSNITSAMASPSVVIAPIILGSSQSFSVTGTDNNGCLNTAHTSILVSACTGIKENSSIEASLSVFPNPNNGLFTVSFKSLKPNTTIEIYNALGALIRQQAVETADTVINLGSEANGLYLVYITEQNKQVAVSKLIKQ